VPSAEEVLTRHRSISHADNLRAWKARFSKSVGRSWDRAWGRTLGNATATIRVKHIGGTAGSQMQGMSSVVMGSGRPAHRRYCFVLIPAVLGIPDILFTSKVSFDPKRGTLQPHSVETRLDINTVFISTPEIVRGVKEWKMTRNKIPVPPVVEPEDPPTTSPGDSSLSPFFEALSVGSTILYARVSYFIQ
jgi:hypothetical protein